MENNKNHILIVDDDDRIRNLLKDYLYENQNNLDNIQEYRKNTNLKYLMF